MWNLLELRERHGSAMIRASRGEEADATPARGAIPSIEMLDLADPDFDLLWPSELFVRESWSLVAKQDVWGSWFTDVENLLEEAFAGPLPRDEFSYDPAKRVDYLRRLIAAAPTLRYADVAKPYFPQRSGTAEPSALDEVSTRRRFASLVTDLERRGYLDRVFPSPCVDDQDFGEVDRSEYLRELLGWPGIWPLTNSIERLDSDTFLGLIEVFHDLAARPRTRHFHSFSSCGWHYSNFAVGVGRELYRWRVNRLLDSSVIPYRLATQGEDVGRLVEVADAGRGDLVDQTLGNAAEHESSRLSHAIALFRRRGASTDEKKSAVIVLAGLLEERRSRLKETLFSKDESALFEIANTFGLRHQNAMQKRDYSPAFVDWIFWWYLSTIELLQRLDGASNPADRDAADDAELF